MTQNFELELEKEQIENFFSATAWALPSRPTSPPTIATVFRLGEFQALAAMNIPVNEVLHGDQQYEFVKDLVAGVTYRGVTVLKHKHEKSAAMKMVFYSFSTEIFDATGELAVTCTTTLIHRTKGTP